MQKLLILSVIFFLQSGFMMTNSLSSQISAMKKDFVQEVFEGLNDDTKVSISLPRSHDGKFSSIEQLDFVIRSGKYQDVNASAIVVKEHGQKVWKVLDIYVQQDNLWVKVPKSKEGKQ